MRADCLVIGAGAAGLAAARDLSRAGLRVIVLEARGRIGGRIVTVRDSGSILPVELGAEFLHGQAKEALALATEARLVVDRLPDTHYWSRAGAFEPVSEYWKKVMEVGRDIERRLARSGRRRSARAARSIDLSFVDYLEAAALPPRLRRLVLQYVEGYHAADPARVSARFLARGSDEEGDGSENRQLRIVSGYDGIVSRLHAGCAANLVDVRLSAPVEHLRWGRDGVLARTTGLPGQRSRQWRARTAVITLPPPVLVRGAIAFEPMVPAKMGAARRLPPAQVCKVILRFREPFWDERFVKERLARRRATPLPFNFVHDGDAPVGTCWTPLPTQADTLTAWAGGPKADQLLDLPLAERLDRVLSSLAGTFGVARRFLDDRFEAAWTHDWRADPWSGGAYGYPEVGALSAQRALARPVGNRLFFAGDSTDSSETATVTGAIASGRRAAREVISVLSGA